LRRSRPQVKIPTLSQTAREGWGNLLQYNVLQTMTSTNAQYWIDRLGLEPHPEGGWYRQTYRAELQIPHAALPASFSGSRAMATAIYFLLDGGNFSAFHRLRSDEMWHFYAGEALVVHVIDAEGNHVELLLGNDPERGEEFQAVVKAGCWFASEVQDRQTFALVGCTVSPGFDFADFELGTRAELSRVYPKHKDLLERLTRR
jgi:predicted cupin superfamily sugar epimerase